MSYSPSLSRLRFVAALAPVALLAGCAMTQTATNVTGTPNAVTLAGSLHGGNQPITGSAVTLYAVGTTGYGTGAVQYAATQSAADAYGSFSFSQVPNTGAANGIINANQNTYSCPTSGDPQMYLVAKGGVTVPGGVSNVAVALITPVGKCSGAAAKFIDLNEVTTVATVAALQQYFNPSSEQLGYPNTTQAALGFANAVATVSNLADVAHGTALSTLSPSSSVAGVTMTGVPEYQKVNTIANILASCVNTAGPNISGFGPPLAATCSTLYSNAVPPPSAAVTSQPAAVYSTATDILSAAYFMFANPTNSQDPNGKTANLYALAGGVGAPFQPSLTAQPLDWSVGITYTPSGTCTNANTANFLGSAEALAVDALGNVWFNNGASANNAVGSLSPTGSPAGCYFGNIPTGRGLTIDTKGNVWVAGSNTTNSVYEVLANGSTLNWPTATAASAIVADGSGNIFYAPQAAAATLQEYVGGANAVATSASVSVGGGTIASGSSYLPIQADASGRIWMSGASSGNFYELYPDATATTTGGYTLANVGSGIGTTVINNGYGAAIDSTGKIFGGNTCCSGVPANSPWAVTPSATAGTATGALGTKFLGGLVAPRSSAVDGAGNVWFGMGYQEQAGVYALAEVDNALANGLSPNATAPGASCASSSPGNTCLVNGGFQKSGLGTVRSLAIDPSGNVWAAANGTTQAIVEIVGQAVPVVTPLAAAAAAGTIGVKP